jgi:hypothetical protein
MLALPVHTRTAWGDFFTGTPTTTLSNEFGTRQNPTEANVYVSNSLFKFITSGGYGGALYCTSSTYLLVESTSFFSCKTSSQYAGAIYFIGTECVLIKVCGYDCCSTYTSATSYTQFSYLQVNNIASSKNYVNFSSIVRCVNEITNSRYMLRMYYGNISCPSVNISLNKCHRQSGIICYPFKDSNSVTCLFTYSSFVDNTASGYNCIMLYTTGAKFEIKSCNILRNTQVTLGTEGTIYTIGNLMIEGSCILENKANNIFYQGDSSYTITLSRCTVDSTSNNGYLTTQNTVTSFILALNHMSTRNCHSEYDVIGTLTPIIQTPSSSKNQKYYYTFGERFCQCQLRDFVSFLFVFVFNFIHLDASKYPWY